MSSSPPKVTYAAAIKQLSTPSSFSAYQPGSIRAPTRSVHCHPSETSPPAPSSPPELLMGDVSLNLPSTPIVGMDAPPCAPNLPCPIPPPDVINAPSVDHSKLADLKSTCLLGKVWGEFIPNEAVISRMKRHWQSLSGEVNIRYLTNVWFLIKFPDVATRDAIFNQRPWFVQDLNFILIPWKPFFKPIISSITVVDQWVKIPFLVPF